MAPTQTLLVTYTPGSYDRQSRETRRFEAVVSYHWDIDGRELRLVQAPLTYVGGMPAGFGPRITCLANVADVRVIRAEAVR